MTIRAVALMAILTMANPLSVSAQTLTPETAGRFVRLALDCVHLEYPNKIAHVLTEDADARTPHQLTPAFFGCYDWHSSVHGHWLLVRLIRLFGNAEFVPEARGALARSLTATHIAGEVAYQTSPGRGTFERPYGLAWLLQLSAELREWEREAPDVDATRWRLALEPLESVAAQRLKAWLPNLSHPIRIGEHAQTAFAFGLVLDWARVSGDTEMERLVTSRIEDYYGQDQGCPMAYEPSGQDFLSSCLAEADLMRRVRGPDSFGVWLETFLPDVPTTSERNVTWLVPEIVTDPTDGKLAHLDGLNLSRAWMLEGIASGLPVGDPRRATLIDIASHHRNTGLASVTGEHYEGGHWLASFATYLVTQRGLR